MATDVGEPSGSTSHDKQPMASGTLDKPSGKPSSAALSTPAGSNGEVPLEYVIMLKAILADGEVDPLERTMLDDYAAEHPVCKGQHVALLAEAGWTLSEWQQGYKDGCAPPPPEEVDKAVTAKTRWKNVSTAFGMASKVNLLAANTAPADLEQTLQNANDNFLSLFFEDLCAYVQEAQRDVLAAKVPLSSYGRVKDALDKLKATLNGRAKGLLSEELASIRSASVGSLKEQKKQLQREVDEKSKETVAEIKAHSDTQVAAARAELKELHEELKCVLARANSPEAAIAKAEGALRESEHKLSKANDKLVKLDAQIKAIESEWESSLAESLKKCTFKVKGRDIKDIEGSMQKSAQQGNATALLTKLMKMEGHGAQLAYLISAYEDAKSAVSDARKAERDNAAEALEKKLEEQQLKAKEWHQERDRLKHAIEEARSAGNEQLNEQLLRQETQENESKVGQDRLYSNFKRAESEVAATKAELVSVKKELSSFKAKLQAMTEARDAMEAKLHAAEQLKADEAAAAQTKYAACLSALNAARSAAKHGGYYFSAAPTAETAIRHASPHSDDEASWSRATSPLHELPEAGFRRPMHNSPSVHIGSPPDARPGTSPSTGQSSALSPSSSPSAGAKNRRSGQRKAISSSRSASKGDGMGKLNTPKSSPKGPRSPKGASTVTGAQDLSKRQN